jgi:predicted GIY-YIG superfamily endonuclease
MAMPLPGRLTTHSVQKHYVYILRSLSNPVKTYVGITGDLRRRMREHNSCSQTYSKRYAPWELVAYVAFSDSSKAKRFEKYLKTGSGKALLKKHFL